MSDMTFVIGASSGRLCSLARLCLRADCAPLTEREREKERERVRRV